ncbi:MAG: 2-hydroxyacyl-CoA dehydratase [bacterium]|nr:2-hydroxyacyl-CoA dehydratase [bacterium]
MEPAPIEVFFDRILRDPHNRLLRKATSDDRIAIGYMCSYIPEVILSIDRFVPVRIRAPYNDDIPSDDTYLNSMSCSYTRSILEYAMDERYDFLDGWIFSTSCDHMRRLCDNFDFLVKPSFSYLLGIPDKIGEAAVEEFTLELVMLIDTLSSHFDVDITNESLTDAVNRQNKFFELLRSVGDFRKLENPPITGSDFHKLLLATKVAPVDLLLDKVTEYIDFIAKQKGKEGFRARLMLIGGEIDDPEFISLIESEGGLVAADRFCTGSLPGLDPIEVGSGVVKSIAEHTLSKVFCPRLMDEYKNRASYIEEIIEEYQIDGVIISKMRSCESWDAEATLMETLLNEEKVPVLILEREYRVNDEENLRAAIRDFLDRIEK